MKAKYEKVFDEIYRTELILKKEIWTELNAFKSIAQKYSKRKKKENLPQK